jgi:hypothetical protein
MGTAERKEKIAKLKEEHENYFREMGIENPLYIPKMAYRPSGKDELYISFFPSELEKEKDIYTEFVSINYDLEDPKRTLYLYKDNPYFKDEYELAVSNSGFERYFVPVSELIIINDVTSRNKKVEEVFKLDDLPNPDEDLKGAILKLAHQFQNLIDILTTKINKL